MCVQYAASGDPFLYYSGQLLVGPALSVVFYFTWTTLIFVNDEMIDLLHVNFLGFQENRLIELRLGQFEDVLSPIPANLLVWY